MKQRLLYKTFERALGDFGWDLFPRRKRGTRYVARPAHDAIFAKPQPNWCFADLKSVAGFLRSCERSVATRIDLQLLAALKRMRATKTITAGAAQ